MLASIITKFGELENEMCYGTSRKDDFIDTVVCLFIRKAAELTEEQFRYLMLGLNPLDPKIKEVHPKRAL